jgi:hypothetical protein
MIIEGEHGNQWSEKIRETDIREKIQNKTAAALVQ